METEKNYEEHYVCLGGCKGVSEIPGACQAVDCLNYNQELTSCDCEDNKHNNFEVREL